LFAVERLAAEHGAEFFDQLFARDQEGAAGLVAAEAVEEPDGVAAAQVQEMFKRSAVEDGGREAGELVEGGGKGAETSGVGEA
jgi:hypothetical protein